MEVGGLLGRNCSDLKHEDWLVIAVEVKVNYIMDILEGELIMTS